MRTRRNLTQYLAGTLLLGLIASISFALPPFPVASSHSAPSLGLPAPAFLADALAVPPSTRPTPRESCTQASLTAPAGSFTLHLKGRIFVEDTTSTSGQALKAVRVLCTLEAQRSPYPISPAIANPSTSVANRQRAP
jgi:hypothetical protein